MPEACVLIPVYNGAPWIEEALDSALAQERIDLEVLVVDDGSTDATPEILRRRAERAAGRIRVLSIGRCGLSRARNAGFDHARGDFVTCLDADDRMHPLRVRLECDALRAHPDAVLSFSGRWNFPDGSDLGFFGFTPAAFRAAPGALFTALDDPVSAMLDAGEYPGTDACTCRTDWARGEGRFDPEYANFMDGERWLRCLRSASAVYVAAPLYQRRLHPAAMSAAWTDVERGIFSALDAAHARWGEYRPRQRERIARFEREAGTWLARRAACADGTATGIRFLFRHAARLHSPAWWRTLAYLLTPDPVRSAWRTIRPEDTPARLATVPLAEVMAADPAAVPGFGAAASTRV